MQWWSAVQQHQHQILPFEMKLEVLLAQSGA